MDTSTKYNLISLFAGAGGLDIGLEMAGFTTIAANELTPQACETLRKNQEIGRLSDKELEDFIANASKQKCYRNWSENRLNAFFLRLSEERKECLTHAEIIEGDIRGVESSVFGKIIAKNNGLFAIAGGPPCQPFSRAGKQATLDCTKNGDLFFEFVRLVADLKPKWFIFENVKGMIFAKTDVIYYCCSNCKHKDTIPFRERQNWEGSPKNSIFCDNCKAVVSVFESINEPGSSLKIIKKEFSRVGYSCDSKILNAADYGAPQIRERLIIVGNREGIPFHWPKPTHQKVKSDQPQQSILFHDEGLKPWNSMYDALWSHGHPDFGALDRRSA